MTSLVIVASSANVSLPVVFAMNWLLFAVLYNKEACELDDLLLLVINESSLEPNFARFIFVLMFSLDTSSD